MKDADANCWDCGGFDVEIMRRCHTHKGVQYCRSCECPYCVEEQDDEAVDAHFIEGETSSEFVLEYSITFNSHPTQGKKSE